jgi:hypothetical protein
LAERSRHHEMTSTQLHRAVPSFSTWDGVAADGYRVYTRRQANRHNENFLAVRAAGVALRRYADALKSAQDEARNAIYLYGTDPDPVIAPREASGAIPHASRGLDRIGSTSLTGPASRPVEGIGPDGDVGDTANGDWDNSTAAEAARAEARRILDEARARLAFCAADVRADLLRACEQLPELGRTLSDLVYRADPTPTSARGT